MNKEELQTLLEGRFKWLHSHPELSRQEAGTTEYIIAALREHGIEPLECGLKTGVAALIRGTRGGRTVALRADIDALPIEERTELDYRSQRPGCMHACGHDFHTAALLGAAILLKEREAGLAGSVKLVFQPSEEDPGGAETVIKTGVLSDVSEIYGLHVMPCEPEADGSAAISAGPTFASTLKFEITVRGRGGHAAMPQECADPIVAACAIVNAAQTIVSRADPMEALVLSFTHIEAGKTWNVIPQTAFLEGTIRALRTETALAAADRLEALSASAARSLGTDTVFRKRFDTPGTDNDSALSAEAARIAADAGFAVRPFKTVMAGEDFAYYQRIIPGVFIGFNVICAGALHDPAFVVSPDRLADAASLLFHLAFKRLEAEGPETGRS